MDVQEMSLFEQALEAVKMSEREGEPDFNKTAFYKMVDRLAESMKEAGVPEGEYRWGDRFLRFWSNKQGTPVAVIYEFKVPSLMTLPGWTEYTTRNKARAAELLEG